MAVKLLSHNSFQCGLPFVSVTESYSKDDISEGPKQMF